MKVRKKSTNNKGLPAKRERKGVLAPLTPMQLYLQEIAKYPLLDPEEEFELAKKHYEEQDVQAAHRLITSNLRLVVKIANDFRRTQINLLDLVQEGTLGLMQAVKKFDPYKGVRLANYASWWIRAYILNYLLKNQNQVKIATTASQRKLFYNLQKETNRLLSKGEVVTPELIAKNLDVKVKDVVEMQKRLSSMDLSLNASSGDDKTNESLWEDIGDERIESIEAILAEKQVKLIFSQYVDEFKASLEGRDKEIFLDRVLNQKPLTLQEVGDRYGISRERARQIEARIIKKLKQFVKEKGTLDIT